MIFFDGEEESSMIYKSNEGNSLNYGFGYFNDINKDQKISVEFDYDDHDDKEEIEPEQDNIDFGQDTEAPY